MTSDWLDDFLLDDFWSAGRLLIGWMTFEQLTWIIIGWMTFDWMDDFWLDAWLLLQAERPTDAMSIPNLVIRRPSVQVWHCALYTVNWIVNTVRCSVYTLYWTLYIVSCTLYTVQCTPKNPLSLGLGGGVAPHRLHTISANNSSGESRWV